MQQYCIIYVFHTVLEMWENVQKSFVSLWCRLNIYRTGMHRLMHPFLWGSRVLLMFRILYNFAAPFMAGGYLRLITNQDDI